MASRKKKDDEYPLIEPAKPVLFARGMHCSEISKEFLRDVAKLKGEQAKSTTGKNDFHPLEDEPAIEQLCLSKAAGLFVFANENKKRHNNIVLGRIYDTHVLDMIELGITKFESILACRKRTNNVDASSYECPLLLFQGEEFANAPEGSEIGTLQSLFLDLFRGHPAKELDLEAIDLALVFTCYPDKRVTLRGYRIAFSKSEDHKGSPKIELLEHGPNVDFVVRRTKLAAPNLAKLARKQPKLPGSGKTKNVSSDALRGVVGQIHMHKQNTDKLVTRSRFKKVLKRNVSTEDKDLKPKKTKSTEES